MLTDKEKMIQGIIYKPDGSELVSLRLKARKLLHKFNISLPTDISQRNEILEELFQKKLAKGIFIEPPFNCDYGFNITVGCNFFANFGCVILDGAPVNIGDDVMLAPNVQIYTVFHPLNSKERTEAWEHTKNINIGNRVWIGGGSIILPGVTIGANSVIGAGSVVTKDIPSAVLAFGNPCRVIKEIS